MLGTKFEHVNLVLKPWIFAIKMYYVLYHVETLHVCGYWSEILCCTITPHLSDIEVKVMGHRF